jgi:hypothetical protein
MKTAHPAKKNRTGRLYKLKFLLIIILRHRYITPGRPCTGR